MVTIRGEVIPNRIRTWINNIILTKSKATHSSNSLTNQRDRWAWACLNQCKQDQWIHNNRCSNSQELNSKCGWISKWSSCLNSTLPHLKLLIDSKSKNSLETAFMDTSNRCWVMSLLQELLVCFWMTMRELISRSFWQIMNTSQAKCLKLTSLFWIPKSNSEF